MTGTNLNRPSALPPATARAVCACVPARRGSAGFTLAEIVIVVVIIGVLSATVLPRFGSSLSRYRAEHATRRVEADLRMVRERAMRHGEATTIVFALDGKSYAVAGVKDLDQPTKSSYRVDLESEPYLAALSIDVGGDDRLVFDGFGIPDSRAMLRVQSGAWQGVVIVDAGTGDVRATLP